MAQKPITVARMDYMQKIADISNESGLPAFVMLEVIERFKSQLEQLADRQLVQDQRTYQEELIKAKAAKEANENKEDGNDA